MSELLPENINLIGEKHVCDALVLDGFTKIKVEPADGEYNHITADGTTINILIRVRTVLEPETYIEFSGPEKSRIISNAMLQNRVAYAAYITVSANGSINKEIDWFKLS